MSEILNADESRLLSKIARSTENRFRVGPDEYQLLLGIFQKSGVSYESQDRVEAVRTWRIVYIYPQYLDIMKPFLERMFKRYLSYEFKKSTVYPIRLTEGIPQMADQHNVFTLFKTVPVDNTELWDGKRAVPKEFPHLKMDYDSFIPPCTLSKVREMVPSNSPAALIPCPTCRTVPIRLVRNSDVISAVRQGHKVLIKFACPRCEKMELMVDLTIMYKGILVYPKVAETGRTYLTISTEHKGLTATAIKTRRRTWRSGDKAAVLYPSGAPMIENMISWSDAVRHLMYTDILEDAIAKDWKIEAIPVPREDGMYE